MRFRPAFIISVVLHPLLLTTYALLTTYICSTYVQFTMPVNMRYILLGMIFLTTAFMPLLSSFVLMRKEAPSDWQMTQREHRQQPLFTTFLYYALTVYFIHRIHLPLAIFKLVLAASFIIGAVALVNIYYKSSLHMAGAGGIVAYFMFIPQLLPGHFFIALLCAITMAGIVGTARLALQAHTHAQLYAGFATGFAIMAAIMLLPWPWF